MNIILSYIELKCWRLKEFILYKIPGMLKNEIIDPLKCALFHRDHVIKTGLSRFECHEDFVRIESALIKLVIDKVEVEYARIQTGIKERNAKAGLKHIKEMIKVQTKDTKEARLFYRFMEKTYKYFKNDRPKLIKEVDKAWDKFCSNKQSKSPRVLINTAKRLQKNLKDRDDKYLCLLIQYKEWL